jgi:formylglycine-generating enzyme required for sulfatase activity
MLRREFISLTAAALPAASLDLTVPVPPLIPAPSSPAGWAAWRQDLAKWREQARAAIGYSDALYRRDDFIWSQSSFCCCFLMLCDQEFYNLAQHRYKVDEWVDQGLREFGGYDSVVLWHAYPRIGLDARNQFDFYRDQPGGLAGVRDVVRRFQARGVRVYIDYNPWDTGTRREPSSDIDALAEITGALGIDGIFLDTMDRGAAEFRGKLDAVRKGVVLESEGALPLENVHNHHMSWAQGFTDSVAPGVLRNKWFERRHMQHQIKRWNHDHTGELHAAWMNGSGIMVWENVFGSWVGWSQRDKSILRSMLPIQRRKAVLFSNGEWTPLVATEVPEVYASLWERGETRLWTLVNRSEKPVVGVVLKAPHRAGVKYFDLVEGRPLDAAADGTAVLSTAIRPRGIACFLAVPPRFFGDGFDAFLLSQARLSERASIDDSFPARTTSPVAPPALKTRLRRAPAGMVEIPAAPFEMLVEYRIRETGFSTSLDYVPGRGFSPLHRPATVTRKLSLSRYAIDLTPVTNAQYAEFLGRAGYRPVHPDNFLKHWNGGTPPAGQGDHPVVWVDLEDARAYATWAGKRLPTEEEWQYAAQGPDRLRYPWGPQMKPGTCNAGETGGTTPVMAYLAGRSPFGCYDMCGNTWEWTESEQSDGRTRFAFLRGGSYYKAEGSAWYMDGGPQPASFAVKFLLMWPGLDRSATVGFRCAAELG